MKMKAGHGFEDGIKILLYLHIKGLNLHEDHVEIYFVLYWISISKIVMTLTLALILCTIGNWKKK